MSAVVLNDYAVRLENNGSSWKTPEHFTKDEAHYMRMPQDNYCYKIVLINRKSRRCDASVEIDDNHVGSFRIMGNSSMTIERPVDKARKFTFFKASSEGASKAGYNPTKSSTNGLIKVTFTPEIGRIVNRVHKIKPSPFEVIEPTSTTETYRVLSYNSSGGRVTKGFSNNLATNESYGARVTSYDDEESLEEGITGLTGTSNQKYRDVSALHYDMDNQVTIQFRLVYGGNADIEPLGTPSKPISTTFPKPVGKSGLPAPISSGIPVSTIPPPPSIISRNPMEVPY